MGVLFDIFCIGFNDEDEGARGWQKVRNIRRFAYRCIFATLILAAIMTAGGDKVLWSLVKKTAIYGFESTTDIIQGILSRSW